MFGCSSLPESLISLRSGGGASSPPPGSFSSRKRLTKGIPMLDNDPRIKEASTLFINFSGGKDSLVMLLEALDTVEPDRILVHHQDLGMGDWPETQPYVKDVCERLKVRLIIERGSRGDLLDMLHAAGKNRRENLPGPKGWPDSKRRWCTSYLKRDVANKYIRAHRKELGPDLVVLTGERREESPRRAKKDAWQPHSTSIKDHTVWSFHPILEWKEDQVWSRIRDSGVEPHPCYSYGVSRASCFMCVFARKSELAIAIRKHPDRFRLFVEAEKEIDHKFRLNLSLQDLWKEVRGEGEFAPSSPSLFGATSLVEKPQ